MLFFNVVFQMQWRLLICAKTKDILNQFDDCIWFLERIVIVSRYKKTHMIRDLLNHFIVWFSQLYLAVAKMHFYLWISTIDWECSKWINCSIRSLLQVPSGPKWVIGDRKIAGQAREKLRWICEKDRKLNKIMLIYFINISKA